MRLTPPRILVFLTAVLLAGLSVASHYAHVPYVGRYVGAHQYWILVAAFVTMTAGVVFPGL